MWFGVFVLNILFPGFIAFAMTDGAAPGRYGIVGAMFLLLVLGNGLSIDVPKIGRPLLLGGVFVGLSQLFPVVQLFAGTAAIEIARLVGLASRDGDGMPRLAGEAGGFAVTLATGVLLMMVSLVLGLLRRRLTHRPWTEIFAGWRKVN